MGSEGEGLSGLEQSGKAFWRSSSSWELTKQNVERTREGGHGKSQALDFLRRWGADVAREGAPLKSLCP